MAALPGLMDRAQRPFEAAGLRRPSYVSLGNHDGTVQGNIHALQVLDDIARGCIKPLTLGGTLEPTGAAHQPGLHRGRAARPSPRLRRRPTYKAIHAAGRQGDAHGFAFVDRDELRASDGHAAYYSFSPRRGPPDLLNTVAEGDSIGSDGNLDTPQFDWIERELKAARGRGELVDPLRPPPHPQPDQRQARRERRRLRAAGGHGPGCDRDPRISRPVRYGPDLQRLLLAHPHVIAYVAGHTHEHRVTAFRRASGTGGFWGIETSSEIDWPIQSRLLEIMDNRDGTLSIFGTLDRPRRAAGHAGPRHAGGRVRHPDARVARSRALLQRPAGGRGKAGDGRPAGPQRRAAARRPRRGAERQRSRAQRSAHACRGSSCSPSSRPWAVRA